jgi:hypothetical protein
VNGIDGQYLRAWQQVAELEGRYTLCDQPGKVRLLGYLESARMGSYKAAVVNYPPAVPALADRGLGEMLDSPGHAQKRYFRDCGRTN